MLNENKMSNVQELLNNIGSKPIVKRIRREAGLIERKENEEKIILTEDNRQVLFG